MMKRRLQAITRPRSSIYRKTRSEEGPHPPAQTAAAELLDDIFRHLSKQDLRSCTLVCSWWCIRSSHMLLRDLTVSSSKSMRPFKRSEFRNFASVARGSQRLAYALRTLNLEGPLDFVGLQDTLQELTSLQKLQLKKAYFTPLGKPPRLSAMKGRKIKQLRLLDVGSHPKSHSPSAPSVWATLVLFSAVGEFRISGEYRGPSENVGIIRNATHMGPKIRLAGLWVQGDLMPLIEAVLQHVIDFRHMKHFSVKSMNMQNHGPILSKFVAKLGRPLISFSLDVSIGGKDMDGESLARQVARETPLWEELRVALSSCTALTKLKSSFRMILREGMIAPISTSWNDHAKALLRAVPSLNDIKIVLSCEEVLAEGSPTHPTWGLINSLHWSLVEAPIGEDGFTPVNHNRRVAIAIKALPVDAATREFIETMQSFGIPARSMMRATKYYENLIRSKLSTQARDTVILI